MLTPERWKRSKLIIVLALLLTVSFSCPVLMAIDDEDNDLPPVILPLQNLGGVGFNDGGEGKCNFLDPAFPPDYWGVGEFGLITNVSVVFETAAQMIPILSCEGIPGLQVSGCNEFVSLTLTMDGSTSTPNNPDARIFVRAPLGELLRVFVDDTTFLVRNHYAFGTTLDEIFVGLFQFDLNSGSDVSSGIVCIAKGDLSNISVDELHKAVRDGRIDSKFCLSNNGTADLDEIIKLAADNLRSGVFDLGVIQVGYNAAGEVVSITNVIVTVDPYSGYGCPIDIEVFTL